MGLLKKLFRRRSPDAVLSGQDDSETVSNSVPINARRREKIQLVLRDSMRKHAIPSDWMECRILSVLTSQQKSGAHVQFIVRQGEERLLNFVHPFQETFWRELEKVDSKPREWLFSVAWQFDGDHGAHGGIVVPAADAAAQGWGDDTQPPDQDTQPPDEQEDQLATDLQALYAIRDAALAEPVGPMGPSAAKPGPH